MLDWFVWKGIRCTSLGIHMLVPPSITVPEERINFSDRIGESGSFASTEAEHPVFSDIQKTVTCMIDNPRNIDRIAAYLHGKGEVEFANQPGGFFYAIINNQIPFDKILRGNPERSFQVPFRCKPFWYPKNNGLLINRTYEPDEDVYLERSIFNPENVYSRPLIRVACDYTIDQDGNKISKGGCELTINGKLMYIDPDPADGTVTIDTELMEAYDDTVTPHVFRNSSISCADFPFLKPGENTFKLTGHVRKFELYPRWRRM